MWDFLERLRAEHATMSAAALVATGVGMGWTAAFVFFRQQITTYTAKLQHLQEIVEGKLPASTYKPIRFRKEKPVLIGVALIALSLALGVAGLAMVVSNFYAVRTTVPGP